MTFSENFEEFQLLATLFSSFKSKGNSIKLEQLFVLCHIFVWHISTESNICTLIRRVASESYD